jgi:hypothetical protein
VPKKAKRIDLFQRGIGKDARHEIDPAGRKYHPQAGGQVRLENSMILFNKVKFTTEQH